MIHNQLFEVKSADILQPGPACLTDGIDHLEKIIQGWAALQIAPSAVQGEKPSAVQGKEPSAVQGKEPSAVQGKESSATQKKVQKA